MLIGTTIIKKRDVPANTGSFVQSGNGNSIRISQFFNPTDSAGFSFCGWVYCDSAGGTNYRGIFETSDAGVQEYTLGIANGVFPSNLFIYESGFEVTLIDAVEADTWQFFFGSVDVGASTTKLGMDTLDSVISGGSITLTSVRDDLNIGSANNGIEPLNGSLAHMKFWYGQVPMEALFAEKYRYEPDSNNGRLLTWLPFDAKHGSKPAIPGLSVPDTIIGSGMEFSSQGPMVQKKRDVYIGATAGRVISYVPWNEPPPQGTPLRKEGLASALSIFVRGDSNDIVEEVTGLRTAYSIGQSLNSGAYGQHIHNDGTGSSIGFDYTQLVNNWTDAATVSGIFRLDGTSGLNRVMASSAGGGEDFLSSWAMDAGNDMGGRIGAGASNLRTEQDISTKLSDWYYGALQRTTGKGQWATNPSGVGLLNSVTTVAPNLMTHNLNFFGTATAVWDLACFAVWARELSQSELNSFYVNPWQVFELRRVFTPGTTSEKLVAF